ncbi:hypothetical protein GuthCp013 (chloroplast) [Guillardia theta]|uniref:Uncharacterized 8.1 kDa protein n=2 Tax=Guillardia theta TaxID=55529 RepID=YCX2_GUITH|nr:hypothetical protein GuthCp013 [Guillardia theta]O78421.1 RecName: Full=Uncharacterized 8.1 kDa protein; AltName: Full=ORF65 [Guillardia theta]AAC35606.1 unknown [Guillardia theta]
MKNDHYVFNFYFFRSKITSNHLIRLNTNYLKKTILFISSDIPETIYEKFYLQSFKLFIIYYNINL